MWAIEPPSQVAHGVGFVATLDVEDQFGNVETGYDGSVTIALDNNPSECGAGRSSSVTASGGVATFSGLTISIVGNGYTLVATGDGLTSPASTPINVTPIPPAKLEMTTQPPARSRSISDSA